MEIVRPFEALHKDDAGIAGGKGASLGEMTSYFAQATKDATDGHNPVPPGFVVLAGAFEHFLDEANLNQELDTIFHTVNHEEIGRVERASSRIQALIIGAKMSESIAQEIQKHFGELGATYVAVRSSATAEDSSSAAWAGQLDTFLNTTSDKLIENVQRCWASLFTPRAIFYRFEKGMHGQRISVAVVVQKMIQSEVSGIAFSVHPVTEDYNQLIIEAGFGLGEAIVSGQVTPDSFVVEKSPRRIIDTNITYQSRALWRGERGGNVWRELSEEEGSKPALSDSQVLELAELVINIEKHYGFPCDIEWAFEAGQFFVTQSRPITTLSPRSAVNSAKQTLIKTLERDATLLMQGVFDLMMVEDMPLTIGSENPFRPQIINYATAENVQLWENKEGVRWLQDQLLVQNQKGPDFIKKIIVENALIIAEIRSYWERGPLNDSKSLGHYLELARTSVLCNAVCFYSGMDERTPEAAREVVMRWRETDELFAKSDSYLRDSLALMGVRRDLAHLVLPHEARDLPDESELMKRATGFVLVDGLKGLKQSLTDYAAGCPDLIFEDLILSKETAQQVKGQSAYRGIVMGTVRIVKNAQHMTAVGVGDILISPMTTPDFLPAMQRAAAFVTDEGGVVCHAAIVAREMKKPCVIGTKTATQVFKDGDMVEVDADRGVVRRIEEGHSTSVGTKKTFLPQDYVLHFEVEGVPLLLIDLLSRAYSRFISSGIILLSVDGGYREFVGKIDRERITREGADFFASAKQFEKFLADLESGFATAERELPCLADPKNKEDVEEFFKICVDALSPYHRTVEFYTDYAYEKSASNPGLKKNIEKLQQVKDRYRLKLNAVFLEKNNFLEQLAANLASRFGLGAEDVLSLTSEQIIDLWRGQTPSAQQIQDQRRAYFFALHDGTISFYCGVEAVDLARALRQEAPETDHVQGTVSSKGSYSRVSGKVRNFRLDYSDFTEIRRQIDEMQKGEILVSITTGPELIDACKKAAAIVTDIGGMLSHAAITAREFNIPCVGETQFGSKIFKTGDMVEVDAERGIVRKL